MSTSIKKKIEQIVLLRSVQIRELKISIKKTEFIINTKDFVMKKSVNYINLSTLDN